jgi:hypothetical protein
VIILLTQRCCSTFVFYPNENTGLPSRPPPSMTARWNTPAELARLKADDTRFAPVAARQNNRDSQNNHHSRNSRAPLPRDRRSPPPPPRERQYNDRQDDHDRFANSNQSRPPPPRPQLPYRNQDGERWSNNESFPPRNSYVDRDSRPSGQGYSELLPPERSERREEGGNRKRTSSSTRRNKSEKRSETRHEDDRGEGGSRRRDDDRESSRNSRDKKGEGSSNGADAIFTESVQPPLPLARASYIRSVPVINPSLEVKEKDSLGRHSERCGLFFPKSFALF